MDVLYINGSAYTVIFDGLSSNHGIRLVAVIEAGEFIITYTFRVNYGYLFVNSTRLVPAPCNASSVGARKDIDGVKGTW